MLFRSQYPVSRELFIYVKRAHVDVVPGLRGYVAEFTGDAAIGEDGYLTEIGLIPLPADQLAAVRQAASSMQANVAAESAR